MPTPDPDKLIRLAVPLLESWMQQDPRHRAMLSELGAYLVQLAGAPDGRLGGALVNPANPAAATAVASPTSTGHAAGSVAVMPVSASVNAAGVRAVAKPAAMREDPVDRMIAQVEAELPRLVGGLAPLPATAPGVAIPPPPPPPALSSALSMSVARVAPDEAAEREMFLAVQKAGHHREQMRKCLKAKDHAAAADHVGRAALALEQYVMRGGMLRPGDEAREVLAGIIDELPDKLVLSAATEKVLDRVFRAADVREEEDDGPTAPPHPAAAAKPVLAGRTAILIGGDVREARRVALERDLGLAELRWIRSTPTNPATRFEPDIKRGDVDLVMIAIRWVRHGTAWAAAEAATKFRKPLVRLPGGLGSNAVAHAVLEQAAEKLRR